MNNYKSCAQWVFDQGCDQGVRVLDYGCGAGEIVQELRSKNVNAYGCDIFYEGGGGGEPINCSLFEKNIVRKMDENEIPFDSSSFDFVINKMVMEHVENLDEVIAEIYRVMKPGALIFSIFPDQSVWHEGHCGVPFLHWFSAGSRARIYYAALFRLFGGGYHKAGKGVFEWSEDFCAWLDLWTHYRTKKEISLIYSNYFSSIHHIEEYWLCTRLGRCRYLVKWLPVCFQRFIVRKMSGLVFVARKPEIS